VPDDPTIDDDLAAWHSPDPIRPRIRILGQPSIEAAGTPPEERTRFYTEIIIYLAQRGRRGATGDQIDNALWHDHQINPRSRRVALSKVRRWLGETPDGDLWLPPNVGTDRAYRLSPGYQLDWHLFRRLRTRGETRGPDGAGHLRAALQLVEGEPLAGADTPYATGYRNPYAWLPNSDIQPYHLSSAIVDTAHQLVEIALAAGDAATARWAVDKAWLADPDRLEDQPFLDAMRIARHEGRTAELRALIDDLIRRREVEVPEDLPVETYAALNDLTTGVPRQ
jgi:hypothetical protein